MTIIYLVVAWALGIWLASLLTLGELVWAGGLVVGGLAAWLVGREPQLRLVLACVAAVAAGGLRYSLAVPPIGADQLAFYNGQEVTITGRVMAEPDVRDRSINLRVAVDSLTPAEGQSRPVTGWLLLSVPRFPPLNYGDQLELSGRMETPPEDETFSYKDYLARQGIYSLMVWPTVTVQAEGQGNPLYAAIFAFKARAQAVINRQIAEPQAALLSGILLGNDSGLPDTLADDFRQTGMTHIIAISGFNIAILIQILVRLADPWLGERRAVWVALLGLAFYTLLVGAGASVVRAAIMGSIGLLTGRWLGRPAYTFASLFLAAGLMTLANPHTLWDIGFQLSFTATLGLMLYVAPLTNWVQNQLHRFFQRPIAERLVALLSDAVLVTLAAQILTVPLMVAYFDQVSLVSLLANILILPAQPPIMTWGGLATLVGLIFPAGGQLLAWVAWLFLAYTIFWVRVLADFPLAAVTVHLSPAGLMAIYLVIGGLTLYGRLKPEQRLSLRANLGRHLSQRLALGGSLTLAILSGAWGLSQPDGQLHVAFLNIGQGDAIFIQTPAGQQILVDGGLYPSLLNEQLGRQMPFWDKSLDLMIATHPDADHVAGLVGVFDRYQVGLLVTDGEGLGESEIYDAVLQAAEAHQTPLHSATAGEYIDFGEGVRLEFLHPGPELDSEERNNNSVSFRLVYGDFSVLLTGDAELEAEQEMVASGQELAALVFKAGHHGSSGSSNEFFLAAVRPQVVVVSAGRDNRYGHPHPDMLQRAANVGAVVLRTDQLGTIEVISDGRLMWWQASE